MWDMKKCEKDVRNLTLKIRVNGDEVKRIKSLQKSTTERSLSNYVRKVVLQKPVAFTHRNLSADDFLKEMVELKKELNAVGNNFNQSVHKLHILDKIPEFRTWFQQNEALQKAVVGKVEEIKLRMNQLYEQWLLK